MIETKFKGTGNNLKNILAILNLRGYNLRQPPPIDHAHFAASINSALVPDPIRYHDHHNDYDGYKVKMKILVFNGSLDDED